MLMFEANDLEERVQTSNFCKFVRVYVLYISRKMICPYICENHIKMQRNAPDLTLRLPLVNLKVEATKKGEISKGL